MWRKKDGENGGVSMKSKWLGNGNIMAYGIMASYSVWRKMASA